MAQTLFDKIWNEHVVIKNAGFPDTLYIDTHVINKIMIPRAFEGLRKRNMDVFKYLISEIPDDVANGHFIEYAGNTILGLDMEGRMAICSISREIGASGGIIAPDETTFEYIAGLGLMPEDENPEQTLSFWNSLFSDESSVFDEVLEFDAEDIGSENFCIHKASYKPSFAELEKPGVNSYDDATFVAGYNDTDYILKHLEIIEEFESSKMYKIFNGA